MGSSVSGSLDKYSKASPAAAVGSGKVQLPETGAGWCCAIRNDGSC